MGYRKVQNKYLLILENNSARHGAVVDWCVFNRCLSDQAITLAKCLLKNCKVYPSTGLDV